MTISLMRYRVSVRGVDQYPRVTQSSLPCLVCWDVDGNAVAHARTRRFHGFVGEVRIPRGGLDLCVTEQLADHRQRLPER